MDEVAQLRRVHPQLAATLAPPGHLRANITTPVCTEGSDFCFFEPYIRILPKPDKGPFIAEVEVYFLS